MNAKYNNKNLLSIIYVNGKFDVIKDVIQIDLINTGNFVEPKEENFQQLVVAHLVKGEKTIKYFKLSNIKQAIFQRCVDVDIKSATTLIVK